MAEVQNSPRPVLVQLPTSAHALPSDRALASLPSPASQLPRTEDDDHTLSTDRTDQQQQHGQDYQLPDLDLDTLMSEAPASQPESQPAVETQAEGEIVPPLQIADQPVIAVASLDETPAEETSDTLMTVAVTIPPTPLMDSPIPPVPDSLQEGSGGQPSPAEGAPDQQPLPPEWVTWEEDRSMPTEQELKEFEGTDANLSALDVAAYEKKLFREWPDPEQRPIKKIRLSWVIKGVRGTRERPNRARVMHSPAAFVDGLYWQIKFYPRGNKNESLSAYIACSANKPTPDTELPESTFAYFEGPPDANVGEGAEPKEVVKTELTPVTKENKTDAEAPSPETADKRAEDEGMGDWSPAATSQGAQETHSQAEAGTVIDTDSDAPEKDEKDDGPASVHEDKDFRIAAQLGMVIYNPAEPRTATSMTSEHQFNQYNDDWGWTSFGGPWREIHKRQAGQFQALLRNDTLALDAYILIFDDPSQALWWHESSDHEPIWPSKRLAGYYPMGTPSLYHSPGVAGLASYFLLAPFRRVLQSIDAGKWRHSSQIMPKPLIALLQQALDAMRHLTAENEDYVDVYKPLDVLKDAGEEYCDVSSFWEVLRRSIELELGEDDGEALTALSDIFDVMGDTVKVPALPVQGVQDIQGALQKVAIPGSMRERGPKFLPLVLKRDDFDQVKREWKLVHDRVALNEEIEIPGSGEKYTLYGFIVHAGERNSARFYSILRPNGPGDKWLAFEDGDEKKVVSYTRHRLRGFEGLEGDALANFRGTRSTAYLAMYIKTSCLSEFLPGGLEHYEAPSWIASISEGDEYGDGVTKEKDSTIDLEMYFDHNIIGHTGLLDLFNIKAQAQASSNVKKYTFPPSTTLYEVRSKLAKDIGLDKPQKLRAFIMCNDFLGQYSASYLDSLRFRYTVDQALVSPLRPLCLWWSTLKTEVDIDIFGFPDKDGKEANAWADPEPLSEYWQSGNHHHRVDEVVIERSVSGAAPESTGQTEAPPPVEHGHLTDAIMSEAEPLAPSTASLAGQQASGLEPNVTERLAEERSTEAGARTPDADAHAPEIETDGRSMPASGAAGVAGVYQSHDDAVDQQPLSPASPDSVPRTASTDIDTSSPQTTPVAPVEASSTDQGLGVRPCSRAQPVRGVYGFLQLFEADKQNFVVLKTFFAKRTEPVKDRIRRCLGYNAEKDFHAWLRDSSLSGSAINDKMTFSDVHFGDGLTIVVGEILGEEKLTELRLQGKFSDPFALSRYRRLRARRHPTQSLTTSEPVEMSDFGAEYFRGPLVNGQPHGPDCTVISTQGHVYSGPMVMAQKSGDSGKMIYQNGDTYEGGWLDDKRHGVGTLVQKRTGNKYVGGFLNDKRWGKGTTYWEMADEEAGMCQICYGADVDALFYDCGHVCACSDCAKQCSVCPICRKDIKHVVRMFWT